jgi:hypothetical protein
MFRKLHLILITTGMYPTIKNLTMMKKLLFLSLVVLGMACSDDDSTSATPKVDPNAIPATSVRLTVTMPTTIMATDVFVVAGSFKADAWSPDKSTYTLSKQTDGSFRVDVPAASFDATLDYKIVRNPKKDTDPWKFVEKDAKCDELAANRQIKATDAGKEVKLKIDNFRNTGTCPN